MRIDARSLTLCGELHSPGCVTSVLIKEVPVNFADKDTSVFMTEPCGNRHEVDARHDADGTEVMSEIVKPEPLQFGVFRASFRLSRKLFACSSRSPR